MKKKNPHKEEKDTIPCPPPSFGEPITHKIPITNGRELILTSSIPNDIIPHYKNYKRKLTLD